MSTALQPSLDPNLASPSTKAALAASVKGTPTMKATTSIQTMLLFVGQVDSLRETRRLCSPAQLSLPVVDRLDLVPRAHMARLYTADRLQIARHRLPEITCGLTSRKSPDKVVLPVLVTGLVPAT